MEATKTKLFDSGRIVSTIGINKLISRDAAFSVFVYNSLRRHLRGDWGYTDDGNINGGFAALNDLAISESEPGRLFSCYSFRDERIYIITEADRSCTTIMFPHEY